MNYTIEKRVDGKTIEKSGFFYYEIDAHEALTEQASANGFKRIDDNSWHKKIGDSHAVWRVTEQYDARLKKFA